MKRSVRGAAVLLAISFSMLGGSVSAQEKAALVSERDKVSYAIGVDVGNSLQPVGPFMDLDAFQRAIGDTFAGKPKAMNEQEAQATDQLLRLNIAVADGQPIPGMPPGSTPPPVDKTKVGVFLGDHVKTGIGTRLGAGTSVGAGSNLYGSGMAPKWVPPFAWWDGTSTEAYRLEAFLATAEKAMARRRVQLTDGQRALFTRLWAGGGLAPSRVGA